MTWDHSCVIPRPVTGCALTERIAEKFSQDAGIQYWSDHQPSSKTLTSNLMVQMTPRTQISFRAVPPRSPRGDIMWLSRGRCMPCLVPPLGRCAPSDFLRTDITASVQQRYVHSGRTVAQGIALVSENDNRRCRFVSPRSHAKPSVLLVDVSIWCALTFVGCAFGLLNFGLPQQELSRDDR